MIPQSVKNSSFKKMIVSAMKGHQNASVKHGVTAANMPHQIKKALHEIKVNGVSASKYIHMDNDHKVTRHEAYQVMKGLKERGLAHHMQTTDTHHYVNHSFEHEHTKQEQFKQQNLAQRAQEMAREQAAKAGQKGATLHAAPTPVHSAWSSAPVHHAPATEPSSHASNFSKPMVPPNQFHRSPTSLQPPQPSSPNITPGGSLRPTKAPEETIDLAID